MWVWWFQNTFADCLLFLSLNQTACDHLKEQKAVMWGLLTSKTRLDEGHATSASLPQGAGFQVLSHLVRNLAALGAAMLEGPQRVTVEGGRRGWNERDRAEEAQRLDFSQRGLRTWGERAFCWSSPSLPLTTTAWEDPKRDPQNHERWQ